VHYILGWWDNYYLNIIFQMFLKQTKHCLQFYTVIGVYIDSTRLSITQTSCSFLNGFISSRHWRGLCDGSMTRMSKCRTPARYHQTLTPMKGVLDLKALRISNLIVVICSLQEIDPEDWQHLYNYIHIYIQLILYAFNIDIE